MGGQTVSEDGQTVSDLPKKCVYKRRVVSVDDKFVRSRTKVCPQATKLVRGRQIVSVEERIPSVDERRRWSVFHFFTSPFMVGQIVSESDKTCPRFVRGAEMLSRGDKSGSGGVRFGWLRQMIQSCDRGAEVDASWRVASDSFEHEGSLAEVGADSLLAEAAFY
jgi:hypothetical protein